MIGYREVGGAWTVGGGYYNDPPPDTLSMFDGGANDPDYFKLDAGESLAINWNGQDAPAYGIMHEFRLYNSYLSPEGSWAQRGAVGARGAVGPLACPVDSKRGDLYLLQNLLW